MKRPPSKGQHFWIGRFRIVGGLALNCEAFRQSGAPGQGSRRVGGDSNLWTISLQGPLRTIFGLAWRSSNAAPSSFIPSLKLEGGFAPMSAPSSAAACSTDSAPRLMAILLADPRVLIASGNGD